MTIVHFDLADEIEAAGYEPTDGELTLHYVNEFEVGDTLITTKPFTVTITDGEGTADLEPTPVGNGLVVRVRSGRRPRGVRRRVVFVPDSPTTVEFTDLTELDPDTLAEPVLADAIAQGFADLQDQIDDIEGSDVDSVAGLSGTVTAAGLKTALNLPGDAAAAIAQEVADRIADVELVRDDFEAADDALHTTITGETTTAISQAVANLLDGTPGALDTLNELAAALGDDANFAATVTTALAGKVPTSRTVNGHALSGDVTVTKSDVGLGNVDNTADANKPISSATQTALNGKATTAQGAKADSLATATAYPSYVTGPRTNPFDAKANAYNLKPSNTRKLRAGLARAMAGGLSEWLIASDSEGAGCIDGVGLTYDRTRAWPIAMRDELSRHGITVGGSGLIGPVDGSALDSRWAKTGAWNDSGRWYSFSSANGATRTLTSPFAGDRVSVLYYDFNDGATFTVTVNGVSQGTVTAASPVGLKVATFTAAIAVGQTIVITKTSAGGIVDIVGAQAWSNANGGLIVHNLSKSGATASGSGSLAWVDNDAATDLGQLLTTKVTTTGAVTPDALFIALGGNDHPVSGASVSTITAAITTLRNRFSNSDCVLVAETPLVTSVVSTANWNTYVAALYDLADTLDVPLVDFRARLGDYDTIVANGLSTDGQGHLIAGANAALGRNLGMLLAS